MIESLKTEMLRWLRVPAEPKPPAGAPESIRVFRASRKFFWLRLIQWGIGQGGALFGMIIMFAVLWNAKLGPAAVPLRVIESVALIGFLIQLPISYLVVRFDYELRWYIVTDRSLRIRYGLWQVREVTMTFANIQQITLRQGPLQRLLGLSDLQVRSAGGSSGGESHGGHGGGTSGHLGYFRGVENAMEIRDLMTERLRRWRDAGLGDAEDALEQPGVRSGMSAPGLALAEAAQELLLEARNLRKTVGK